MPRPGHQGLVAGAQQKPQRQQDAREKDHRPAHPNDLRRYPARGSVSERALRPVEGELSQMPCAGGVDVWGGWAGAPAGACQTLN